MREKTLMRRLLVLFWATVIVGAAIDVALEHQLPGAVREYVNEFYENPGPAFWAAAALGLASLWLSLSGSLRLARLRPKGPFRFTAGLALGTALMPLYGPVVYNAWAAVFYEASLIIGGVLVGWLYLHSVPLPTTPSSSSAGPHLPPPIR